LVESVLTRAACIARKALGDATLIRTVHGRGYRWSTPVSEDRDTPTTALVPTDPGHSHSHTRTIMNP
jgi:DNA-binding winged helix-turn-helix (wHTH) protein